MKSPCGRGAILGVKNVKLAQVHRNGRFK